jgi:hypothetical protein
MKEPNDKPMKKVIAVTAPLPELDVMLAPDFDDSELHKHGAPPSQDRARIVFDCRMANDPVTINKESTNENNTDVDRWADARRLRINGKPCS